MSSKSKRRPHRQSATALGNRHLLVFLWAWASVCKPSKEQLVAVTAEILNVLDSIRKGTLKESDMAEALKDECQILTDWQRRDRGA